MEDFGNIFYVLGAIAWFAWNTYKKSQGGKKKPATASSTSQQVDLLILSKSRNHWRI